MRFVLFTLFLALAGCAQTTKEWHRAPAARGSPDVHIYAVEGSSTTRVVPFTVRPPRGPSVPAYRLSGIHVGDSGDRIYYAARKRYPYYDRDLAFVATRIFGRTYEVGFRYAADSSGRIADISYLPISK